MTTNHLWHALCMLFPSPKKRIYWSYYQFWSHPHSHLPWIFLHHYRNLPPRYWSSHSSLPMPTSLNTTTKCSQLLTPTKTLWIDQNLARSGAEIIRRSQLATRKETLPLTGDRPSPTHHHTTWTPSTPLQSLQSLSLTNFTHYTMNSTHSVLVPTSLTIQPQSQEVNATLLLPMRQPHPH